jgi:hypothetical protein
MKSKQEEALDIVVSGHNLLLTGQCGTEKHSLWGMFIFTLHHGGYTISTLYGQLSLYTAGDALCTTKWLILAVPRRLVRQKKQFYKKKEINEGELYSLKYV